MCNTRSEEGPLIWSEINSNSSEWNARLLFESFTNRLFWNELFVHVAQWCKTFPVMSPTLKILHTNQGFPNFSGSAHVTTQTNFGAQVTTLFEKVTTFYLMMFWKFKSYYIFSKSRARRCGRAQQLRNPWKRKCSIEKDTFRPIFTAVSNGSCLGPNYDILIIFEILSVVTYDVNPWMNPILSKKIDRPILSWLVVS